MCEASASSSWLVVKVVTFFRNQVPPPWRVCLLLLQFLVDCAELAADAYFPQHYQKKEILRTAVVIHDQKVAKVI
jgi:hypothetical protein